MADKVTMYRAADGSVHETPKTADEHDHRKQFEEAMRELFMLPQSKAWAKLRQGSVPSAAPGAPQPQFQQTQQSENAYVNSGLPLSLIWLHRQAIFDLLAQAGVTRMGGDGEAGSVAKP